jgi:hypothetical protein
MRLLIYKHVGSPLILSDEHDSVPLTYCLYKTRQVGGSSTLARKNRNSLLLEEDAHATHVVYSFLTTDSKTMRTFHRNLSPGFKHRVSPTPMELRLHRQKTVSSLTRHWDQKPSQIFLPPHLTPESPILVPASHSRDDGRLYHLTSPTKHITQTD